MPPALDFRAGGEGRTLLSLASFRLRHLSGDLGIKLVHSVLLLLPQTILTRFREKCKGEGISYTGRMHEIHCIVSGHVQGVAYRTYVQDAATEFELGGYVRNLSDKTVEVVAQGDPTTLKSFIEYLHEGSLLATVEGVAVEWRTAEHAYNDFSIRHD